MDVTQEDKEWERLKKWHYERYKKSREEREKRRLSLLRSTTHSVHESVYPTKGTSSPPPSTFASTNALVPETKKNELPRESH